MHEVLIISGKGGTGKTTLTAAFAHLASNHVICDLDVDAPDMHLLLAPDVQASHDFISGNKAEIDPDKCTNCGLCLDHCRFEAVEQRGDVAWIDPLKCEGCKVCVHFCPTEAIAFPENHCGSWYVSNTRFGTLVHARLFPGQENSGRLVDLLRRQARELAEAGGKTLILSDGPPGLGCPVISSLSGVNLAVVVTEPTPSGVHDLGRVVELCRHFRADAGVIVNKYDLNIERTEEIEAYCREENLPVFARLAHDTIMTEAMVQGLAVTEFSTGPLSASIRQAWTRIESSLSSEEKQSKQTVGGAI